MSTLKSLTGFTFAKRTTISVNNRVCHHCGACVAVCPSEALFLWNGYLAATESACNGCLRCIQVCPVAALIPAGPARD